VPGGAGPGPGTDACRPGPTDHAIPSGRPPRRPGGQAKTGSGAPAVLIDTVAWVCVQDGQILCARPRGLDVFFIPGGKREAGESDLQTLLREVREELTVQLDPGTAVHVGTYQAAAHGQPAGVEVRMSCYTARYQGRLTASSEISELAWFGYASRDLVPPVDQLLFDDLKAAGELW
jgi:8-oxo-dGTP diphosphatase